MRNLQYPVIRVLQSELLALTSNSKGDAAKWYLSEQDCFVKANRVDHGREYQDSIAEVIASRLAKQMGIPCVEYALCWIQEEDRTPLLGTISRNFCGAEESYLSFETMLENSYEPVSWGKSARENYDLTLNWIKALTGLDGQAYLDSMLLLDSLICNEDRHLNNFGVLQDLSRRTYRFPPLFDNGYALGFLQAEYKLVEQYLYSCKAKPFSTSLTKQLQLIEKLPENVLLPDEISEDLFVGLPLQESEKAYCRAILEHQLTVVKERWK